MRLRKRETLAAAVIALALVAGFVFVWLFNKKQPAPPPKDEFVEVTVAAANIWQSWEVKPIQVKKVEMPKADYEALVKRAGQEPLVGNQAVGRITKHMVRTESPFFADDLHEPGPPVPVAKLIRSGYRSVVVAVSAKAPLVQVGAYVNVDCTLSDDTEQIAKAAKVVARFGTARPGSPPPGGPDAPRQYTLEVTPYRMALIELGKTVGGKFSVSVVPTTIKGDSVVPPAGNDPSDPREQSERVSGDDLKALFKGQAKPE